MRATAVSVAVGTLLTTTAAVVDDCPCGYADANGVFTDIRETDFTTARDLIAVRNGWQIQEWSVPASPAANVPYGRSTSRSNVVSDRFRPRSDRASGKGRVGVWCGTRNDSE